MIFKRGEPCSIELIHPLNTRNISKILLSSPKARWALLIGQFGTGKTTTVLHAAKSQEKTVIFQPCSNLLSSYFPSTNELLEHVVKSLNIFGDFEDQDQEVLSELAGPVLGNLLRRPSSPYILILDGLDEHRAFSNYEGLQQLSNQLADLTCFIIMTTREEHLNALFGNFSSAFYEFSTKRGLQSHAQLFKLIQWNEEQVCQFVIQILNEVKGNEKKRLSEFLQILNNGKYIHVYDKLLYNPLFLQFILEDVVNYGIRKTNRCLLLRSWIEQKIRRDWKVPRVKLNGTLDIEDFVARMIMLMENIANLMTSKIGRNYQLTEYIPSYRIREEAESLFRVSTDPLLSILLNSVLIPQSVRKGLSLNVTFAFRIFHEYFLASYLVRENLRDDGYPDNIRSFYLEIKSCKCDI